jgi:pimeloyl-ACP methyl ester carboxylesterase
MRAWGQHFTCIAPDSPGFGQSDPLPEPGGAWPDIGDFAEATIAFLESLGLVRVHAYGFHSGGTIAVAAMNRNPERFLALAIGGYSVWTAEESRLFAERYLPPFLPQPYGEHLSWLWHRIREQSWVFPWFDVRDAARMPFPHDDPVRVNDIVMEMLDAGDFYRRGYGAVMQAPSGIPPAEAVTPPVLISAYHGDPLQAHIDRFGTMPGNWNAVKVDTREAHHALSLDFLRRTPGAPVGTLPAAAGAGFVPVAAGGFKGLIHWHGDAVDPPGHGLSDEWSGDPPEDWPAWQLVFDAFESATGRRVVLPPLPKGDPDRLYPDLTPDRHGAYLTRAWSIARAAALFDPWYEVSAATARPIDPARITPEALAIDMRNRLRATAARALHKARQSRGER